MKSRTLLLLFCLSFCRLSLHAHQGNKEYTCQPNDSTACVSRTKEKIRITATESFNREFSYMGIPFITAGLIVKKQNSDFRTSVSYTH